MTPWPRMDDPRDHDRSAATPTAGRRGRRDAAGRPGSVLPFAPWASRFAGRAPFEVGWTTAGAMAPVDARVRAGRASVGGSGGDARGCRAPKASILN